ncbi:MAG: hypothetical protein E7000_01765 [Coriobacteriaceae bacterium]|jgi:hypothetical protein|nr:hypothetical protein [Coriobacteriaceae bacterium]
MASNTKTSFESTANEKLHSPDDLDRHIRVTNFAVWVVLFVCIAFMLGLLGWSVLGSVSTTVSATGVASGTKTLCYLDADAAKKVNVGDAALVDNLPAHVTSVDSRPSSREEANQVLASDYLVSILIKDNWAYAVTLEQDGPEMPISDVPLTVNITVEQVSPITLVLGQQER